MCGNYEELVGGGLRWLKASEGRVMCYGSGKAWDWRGGVWECTYLGGLVAGRLARRRERTNRRGRVRARGERRPKLS